MVPQPAVAGHDRVFAHCPDHPAAHVWHHRLRPRTVLLHPPPAGGQRRRKGGGARVQLHRRVQRELPESWHRVSSRALLADRLRRRSGHPGACGHRGAGQPVPQWADTQRWQSCGLSAAASIQHRMDLHHRHEPGRRWQRTQPPGPGGSGRQRPQGRARLLCDGTRMRLDQGSDRQRADQGDSVVQLPATHPDHPASCRCRTVRPSS